jgi:DNA-binding NarL/FixJ family response regulator
MARGLSSEELAEALFISENTVKTHVKKVLTKLGVRDRVNAVVMAYQGGLMDG